jgi:CshA-type fibril repeat protein
MNNLMKISRKSVVTLLAVVTSVLLVLASAQAFAASAMTSSLSVSTANAGDKVDLTTQIPAVSAVDNSTQEIIQTIDPTKVRLTSAADVKAPSGWSVTYSTDGTNFVASSSITNWASVVKVKATGTVNSGGSTIDGKQIITTTATSPGTVNTVDGASRAGGDGYDTEFDSRGYLYNTYHHNYADGALDCRKRSDGSFCGPNWPFGLASKGFSSNFASTQFFDEVYKHLWLPVADRSTGTGFLCIDVSDVLTPQFCGGSKATAWNMIQPRANANEAGVTDIIGSNGKVYAWDMQAPRVLCFDYLANNGLGAACSSMPTFSRLVAGSIRATNNIPFTYSGFKAAFGNIYGQLNGVAVCFNATTQAKCTGWAEYDFVLGTNSSVKILYVQPNAAGEIAGVCSTADAQCFAADGTRFAANATVQAGLTQGQMSYWNGAVEKAGSKLLWTSYFDKPSTTYCYDYATSSACAGWAASSFLISGVGQLNTGSWRIYTLKTDPLSDNCMWTNGDLAQGIKQFTISTAQPGCAIKVDTVSYAQSAVQPRLTCEVGDVSYDKFTIGGATAGVDYSTASLTIVKANGDVAVSGGKTWSNLPFNASGFVDLSTLSFADVGLGSTFKVAYANRTTNNPTTGTLTMKSESAQLCLEVTTNVACPSTTQITNLPTQVTSFSATAATIASTGGRIDYNVTSDNLSIAPPSVPSACGFLLTAQVGAGNHSQAFPANAPAVSGATAILADSAGTTLTDAQGQPITAVSDASGVLSFGYVKPGTYRVKFTDFPVVNGVAAGDIVSVYISPYTFTTGASERDTNVSFTTVKNPLASDPFTGAAGTPTIVKALYIMRATGTNDVVSVKAGASTLIDVKANDTPTTTATFTNNSLKICAAGTTTGCNLSTLTVAGKGTYTVSSGQISFAPIGGYTGVVDTITYLIADSYSGNPTITATLATTVVPAPTPAADTLSGNTLAPITVDVTTNDTAALGATLDKASVKLCASGTTTGCALTTVNIADTGSYSVNNLGVVTFTPASGYVGPVPAITYSINDSVGNTATATVTATVTNTPPRLTTPAFAPAYLGENTTYPQTQIQGSGIIPATGAWSVVGSVPPGMTFDVNTGSITGSPSTLGTYEFTVEVTDANGLTSSKVESILVGAPPVITTSPLTYKLYKDTASNIPGSATAGSGIIPATGAWSATGLPAGLSINTTTGAISGTPTATGTFTVTQKVTDSNTLFDVQDLTIKVVAKPIITTPALTGFEINQAITPVVQTKTVGSALLPTTNAWSIVAGALPNGLSLNSDTGEITGTPTQSGTFPITVKLVDEDGEFSQQVQNITVGIPPVITTTPLTQKLYVGVAASIPSSATAGTGVIPTTGAWSATGLPAGLTINAATGAITGTPSVAGTFSVIQKVTDANGLFDLETITVNVVVKPVITTTVPLPKLTVGVVATPIAQTKTAGTAAIAATGAWSITSGTLPAGLTLNPDTGAISGTPSVAGNFPITVKLTDEAGEFATKDEVVAVIAPPTITTTPLTRSVNLNAQASIANTVTIGSADISVFNGWTATGLPQGLGINGITGVISGTPTTPGTFQVTVRAEDLNGLSDTEVLTINVVNGPNITTTPTSYKFGVNNDLNFMADDFFAQQFPLSKSRIINNTATQGSAPIKATGGWSATGLPQGLVINPDNGKISGIAKTVGEYPVEVTVTDTAGNTSSKILDISIVQGPKNTTARVWNYQLDINKRVGTTPVSITQTYTLGSAPLSDGRPVPFLVQGQEPSPVLTVSIVDGKISVLPSNGQLRGKEKYGSYTLKTLIVDKNGAYDLATFTINLLKPGSNLTTLPLPTGITDGMQMTASTYPLAGTSSAKLPVTYTSSTPSVCTVDSAKKTLKMVNQGKCTISASSGTGTKLSKASQSFTITKLPQTVSIVTPGELIPGGLLTAPMPTDDPNGFKLHAYASSGLTPKYESLDPNICSIDVNGLVTWDADLSILPRVESDFKCRIKVSQAGNTTYSAAASKTITLVATHVEPAPPEGGVTKEPAQTASLPATGGTTPMLGGTAFQVLVDSKKKTVTVKPMSKGRWIGPIYADITITYTPKGASTPSVQTCKRNYFGIAIYNSKKAMVAPALGGDNMVIPELPTYKSAVDALIKKYQAMPGKFTTSKVVSSRVKVKGKYVTVKKTVVSPGYLDWKPLYGEATCVLDSKAYAAWKSGVQIEAKATVTRDRRWPTTYTKYKSYDWKKKSNNGLIFPTVVDWTIKIGK